MDNIRTSKSITVSDERWETERADIRRELGADLPAGTHVEVYAEDGVTLDAWETR